MKLGQCRQAAKKQLDLLRIVHCAFGPRPPPSPDPCMVDACAQDRIPFTFPQDIALSWKYDNPVFCLVSIQFLLIVVK